LAKRYDKMKPWQASQGVRRCAARPERRSRRGQSRPPTVNARTNPQVGQSLGNGPTAPQPRSC